MVLGSSSIFDKLTNREIIINIIETCIEAIEKNDNKEKFVYSSIQNLLKLCVENENNSKKNLSCIIIFFENFINFFEEKKIDYLIERLSFLKKSNNKDNIILCENVICKREVNESIMINFNCWPVLKLLQRCVTC